MKRLVLAISFCLLLIFAFLIAYFFKLSKQNVVSPLGKPIFEKPLDKYAFENLRKKEFKESQITLGRVLKDEDNFTSRIFYFEVPSAGHSTLRNESQGSDSKSSGQVRASGMINLPKKEGAFPVIVMFRGFVPKGNYTIGEGTRHAGEVFAQNGFITLAPDFLGYGESSAPSADSIEERFQTYTTALTLLASIKNLNKTLCSENSENSASQSFRNSENLNVRDADFPSFLSILKIPQASAQINKCSKTVQADPNKIGLWGHSNGGHIALVTLELSGKNYPTVLWTPVSKPFPYSILYYTDEFDDNGKALRKVLANFEKDYDVEKYSPTNYFNWINAPIQIHQGKEDEEVPQKWSDNLATKLKDMDKKIEYFIYPLQDHNFSNVNDWTAAVLRSIDFFRKNFNS